MNSFTLTHPGPGLHDSFIQILSPILSSHRSGAGNGELPRAPRRYAEHLRSIRQVVDVEVRPRSASDHGGSALPRGNGSWMVSHQEKGLFALLGRQSAEIVAQILRWLEPPELLILRATCHQTHKLVHDFERAICSSLRERCVNPHNSEPLYRTPKNLSAFFQTHNRYTQARDLSLITADHVVRSIRHRRFSTPGRQEASWGWRKAKRDRLWPALFPAFLVLGSFCEFMTEIFEQEDGWISELDDSDPESYHDIFDLDQQAILTKHFSWLTREDCENMASAIGLLRYVAAVSGIAFHLPKGVRDSVPSVKMILLKRGIGPVAEILRRSPNKPEQGVACESIRKDLWEGGSDVRKIQYADSNRVPLPTIHHLSDAHPPSTFMTTLSTTSAFTAVPVVQNPPVSRESGRSWFKRRETTPPVVEQFVHQQDLWDRAAKAYVMRKLGREPELCRIRQWIRRICLDEDETESEVSVAPSSLLDQWGF